MRTEAFVMTRIDFLDTMNSPLGKKMIPRIEKDYQEKLRTVLYKNRSMHQKEMSLKFDHIQHSIFGIEHTNHETPAHTMYHKGQMYQQELNKIMNITPQ